MSKHDVKKIEPIALSIGCVGRYLLVCACGWATNAGSRPEARKAYDQHLVDDARKRGVV